MRKLLLLLPFILFSCGDYPASEKSEASPIEINIEIQNKNQLADPSDNDSVEIEVDSQSDSKSDSQSESQAESNSEATVDNATGLIFYEFQMIN